jgi:hypothetical protein
MEKSVLNALRASDVTEEHIEYIQKKLNGKFFNVEDCDKELVKLGYEPIFVLDEDDFEDDFEDDGLGYEKIQHKKYLND